MKNLTEIYDSIRKKFTSYTNLDVAEGSVLDSFFLSSSTGIEEAYAEIEAARNPHIFTNLSGYDIDKTGMLVGCARELNEDDQNYLYRMLNWNTSNKASNLTAIESALQNMTYANNVTYIPLTQGVGTATAYIIPKDLSQNTIDLAINETKEKLTKVSSPGSFISYVVPKILPVEITCFANIDKDSTNVKANIASKIESYINNISPGNYLEVGQLNKIGVNETNVSYFSVSNIIINDEELQELQRIQKLEEKLVFSGINWNIGGIS